jgi:hypothetical protein
VILPGERMGKLFGGPIRLGRPVRLLHADRRRCRRRQAADGQSIPEDMIENLQGRRVLVTGGSRGLGLAMVEALLVRGAKVTVLARTRARLRDAEQLGADAIQGDATDAPWMDGLVADIKPAVVILNAGATPQMGPIDEQSFESFSAVWNNGAGVRATGRLNRRKLPKLSQHRSTSSRIARLLPRACAPSCGCRHRNAAQ